MTSADIEFYYDQDEKGTDARWDCTCEDQKWNKGPKGLKCDHIFQKVWVTSPLSESFSVKVPSRSRTGLEHTVTYTAASEIRYRKLAARLYQHADGYPHSIIPDLRRLEDIVSGVNQSKSIYGSRVNDPEWCAAEYVSEFRQPGTGNIYVSQDRHDDTRFLYKVYCHVDGFHIEVFVPGNKRITDVTAKYHPITGQGVK
jgi:hypothetical protein